jgi:hypothetical protein
MRNDGENGGLDVLSIRTQCHEIERTERVAWRILCERIIWRSSVFDLLPAPPHSHP